MNKMDKWTNICIEDEDNLLRLEEPFHLAFRVCFDPTSFRKCTIGVKDLAESWGPRLSHLTVEVRRDKGEIAGAQAAIVLLNEVIEEATDMIRHIKKVGERLRWVD